MRLVERGRVLLNTPVAEVVPEFGQAGKGDVRLWHLLTHTSGLDEAWVVREAGPAPRRPERLLALASAAPLQFRPASRYAYLQPDVRRHARAGPSNRRAPPRQLTAARGPRAAGAA